jgi:hypothetical protein
VRSIARRELPQGTASYNRWNLLAKGDLGGGKSHTTRE